MYLDLFVHNANISACRDEIRAFERRISKLPSYSWNKIQVNYYNEKIEELKKMIQANQNRILNLLESR